MERLAEEGRRAEEERIQKAIQEREEEERKAKEEEERLKKEKEETEKKSKEEAEKREAELQEKLKKEEEERLARKKRIEEIMARTRGKTAAPAPKVGTSKLPAALKPLFKASRTRAFTSSSVQQRAWSYWRGTRLPSAQCPTAATSSREPPIWRTIAGMKKRGEWSVYGRLALATPALRKTHCRMRKQLW